MNLKKVFEKTTIADRLLLVVLITLSVSSLVFIKKAFPQGTDVKIEVDGALAYILPLNTDTTVSVKGTLGDTVVEIKNRKVHVKESPCPNKICVHEGWIDRGAIICLPNRVCVFIDGTSGKKDNTLDAITG